MPDYSKNSAKIKVAGGNPQMRSIIKKATRWMLGYLVGSRIVDSLEINISLIDNLKKNEGAFGDCVYTGDNVRPREFDIRIDANQTPYSRLLTLSHELIHVKQYVKNEMFEYSNASLYGAVRYKNKIYWYDNIKYRKLPWEKEAFAKQRSVLMEWADANDGYAHIKQRKDY